MAYLRCADHFCEACRDENKMIYKYPHSSNLYLLKTDVSSKCLNGHIGTHLATPTWIFEI